MYNLIVVDQNQRIDAQEALRKIKLLMASLDYSEEFINEDFESEEKYSRILFNRNFAKKDFSKLIDDEDYELALKTGIAMNDFGLYDKSLSLFNTCEKYLSQKGQTRQIEEKINIMFLRAQTLKKQGENEQVMQILSDVVSYCEKQIFQLEKFYYKGLLLRANIYYILNNFEYSLLDLDSFIKISKSPEKFSSSNFYKRSLIILYLIKTKMYYLLGNFDKTEDYIEKVQSLYKEDFSFDRFFLWTKIIKIKILIMSFKLEQADIELFAVMDYLSFLNHPPNKITLRIHIFNCLLAIRYERFEEAMKGCRKAHNMLELVEKNNTNTIEQIIIEFCLGLSQLYINPIISKKHLKDGVSQFRLHEKAELSLVVLAIDLMLELNDKLYQTQISDFDFGINTLIKYTSKDHFLTYKLLLSKSKFLAREYNLEEAIKIPKNIYTFYKEKFPIKDFGEMGFRVRYVLPKLLYKKGDFKKSEELFLSLISEIKNSIEDNNFKENSSELKKLSYYLCKIYLILSDLKCELGEKNISWGLLQNLLDFCKIYSKEQKWQNLKIKCMVQVLEKKLINESEKKASKILCKEVALLMNQKIKLKLRLRVISCLIDNQVDSKDFKKAKSNICKILRYLDKKKFNIKEKNSWICIFMLKRVSLMGKIQKVSLKSFNLEKYRLTSEKMIFKLLKEDLNLWILIPYLIDFLQEEKGIFNKFNKKLLKNLKILNHKINYNNNLYFCRVCSLRSEYATFKGEHEKAKKFNTLVSEKKKYDKEIERKGERTSIAVLSQILN